jgi:hypothetical protein
MIIKSRGETWQLVVERKGIFAKILNQWSPFDKFSSQKKKKTEEGIEKPLLHTQNGYKTTLCS